MGNRHTYRTSYSYENKAVCIRVTAEHGIKAGKNKIIINY